MLELVVLPQQVDVAVRAEDRFVEVALSAGQISRQQFELGVINPLLGVLVVVDVFLGFPRAMYQPE